MQKRQACFFMGTILDLPNKIVWWIRMSEEKKCCGSRSKCENTEKQMTLDKLPVGTTATIVEIKPNIRGEKKFADVGLVVGSELLMEAHAPLGGLIRVKVMETSMALHKKDASNFIIEKDDK